MSTREILIKKIDAFLRKTKMPPTRFGIEAINDGKLYARLQAGDDITTKNLDRVLAYMADYRQKKVRRDERLSA